MPNLYDFEASQRRVLSAEQAVEKQKALILTLEPSSEGLQSAKVNLQEFVEMAITAKKSHLLIMNVLRAKDGTVT